MWVGHNVAAVKQPQAVLPIKKIMLTMLPASPRPIFRLFCSDAIVVLWRYWAERWTPMASYGGEKVNIACDERENEQSWLDESGTLSITQWHNQATLVRSQVTNCSC